MTTTTRRHDTHRTPAGRAVPVLIGLGLLLWLGWLLLATGWLDELRPHASSPAGTTTISIPRIGVKATIVGVGLQADGAMQVPEPDQVGWYKLGPRPGAPGPAVLVGHVDSRTGHYCDNLIVYASPTGS